MRAEMRITMVFMLLAVLTICVPRSPAQESSTKPAEAVSARKFTPFTLITQNYVYDSSGTRGLNSRRVVARRSDGATVTLNFQPQDKQTGTHPRVRTITFLDGRFWDVYDSIHAFVKWPATRERTMLQRNLLAPLKDCLLEDSGEYLDKYETWGDVSVAVIRSLPKGSSGTTFWLAPSLGCQQLQTTYTQVRSDGSFRLVSEEKFVSIKLGEPEAALFTVPSTYASLIPSNALHEEFKHNGRPWDSQAQEMAARMDTAYARRIKESQSSSH